MKKYYRLTGFIILAVILSRIDFQKLIAQFSRLNIISFVIINTLLFPGIFLKAYRWRYLLKMQGIEYSLRASFLSYLGGIFAGIITPGRAGEAVKAIYLRKDKNLPIPEGLASVFLDRLLDLLVLFCLGSAGMAYFLDLRGVGYGMAVALVILSLLLIIFLLLSRVFLEKSARAIYKLLISGLDSKLFEGQFKSFFSASRTIINKGLFIPFILTFASYAFYFWQCFLLARLISIDISFGMLVSFVSISVLVSILPITLFGIGTREMSLVYLFSLSGINAETAFAYSFLLFISFYVIPGIFSSLGWFIKTERIAV